MTSWKNWVVGASIVGLGVLGYNNYTENSRLKKELISSNQTTNSRIDAISEDQNAQNRALIDNYFEPLKSQVSELEGKSAETRSRVNSLVNRVGTLEFGVNSLNYALDNVVNYFPQRLDEIDSESRKRDSVLKFEIAKVNEKIAWSRYNNAVSEGWVENRKEKIWSSIFQEFSLLANEFNYNHVQRHGTESVLGNNGLGIRKSNDLTKFIKRVDSLAPEVSQVANDLADYMIRQDYFPDSTLISEGNSSYQAIVFSSDSTILAPINPKLGSVLKLYDEAGNFTKKAAKIVLNREAKREQFTGSGKLLERHLKDVTNPNINGIGKYPFSSWPNNTSIDLENNKIDSSKVNK